MKKLGCSKAMFGNIWFYVPIWLVEVAKQAYRHIRCMFITFPICEASHVGEPVILAQVDTVIGCPQLSATGACKWQVGQTGGLRGSLCLAVNVCQMMKILIKLTFCYNSNNNDFIQDEFAPGG